MNRIIIMGECDEFVPTYWARLLKKDDKELEIDSHVEIPNSRVIGLLPSIEIDKIHLHTLNSNSFTPKTIIQSLKIYDGEKYYIGCVESVTYSPVALDDLRSAHNIDARQVLTDLIEEEILYWLDQYAT